MSDRSERCREILLQHEPFLKRTCNGIHYTLMFQGRKTQKDTKKQQHMHDEHAFISYGLKGTALCYQFVFSYTIKLPPKFPVYQRF